MHRPLTSEIVINAKGMIDVTWGPTIDSEEYLGIAGQMLSMILDQQDRGIEPLMIIDFSHMEDIAPDAALIAAQATKELECRKIAGFGIPTKFQGILDTIKIRSTRADSIRDFATREEAETWLLQE